MDLRQLRQLADQAADAQGIPRALIRAIVSIESSWRPDAYRHEPGFFRRYIKGTDWERSHGGDSRRIAASYGLGQLMWSTAVAEGFSRTLDPEELFDPELNLRYTAKHLRRLWDRHGGDIEDVAAAYNSGRPKRKAPSYTVQTYLPRFRKALTMARKVTSSKAARVGPPALLLFAGLAALIYWYTRG